MVEIPVTKDDIPTPEGLPAGASQVVVNTEAENATNILHTVPGGENFYLTALFGSVTNTAAAAQIGDIYVRDLNDSVQYYLMRIRVRPSNEETVSTSFPLPIIIPAGWDVVVSSPIAGLIIEGIAYGYEY